MKTIKKKITDAKLEEFMAYQELIGKKEFATTKELDIMTFCYFKVAYYAMIKKYCIRHKITA